MLDLGNVNQSVVISQSLLQNRGNLSHGMASRIMRVTQFNDLPIEIVQKIADNLNAVEYSFLRETCSQLHNELMSISDMEKSLMAECKGRLKQRFERMVDEKKISSLLHQSSPNVLEALNNISEWRVGDGDEQHLRVFIAAINDEQPSAISELVSPIKQKLYDLPLFEQFFCASPVDSFQYYSDPRFFVYKLEPYNIDEGQIAEIFHYINNFYDKCSGPDKLFAAYIATLSKNFLYQIFFSTDGTFTKELNDATAAYPRLFSAGDRLLKDFPYKDTMGIKGKPDKPLPGLE